MDHCMQNEPRVWHEKWIVIAHSCFYLHNISHKQCIKIILCAERRFAFREFDYVDIPKELFCSDIINLLSAIHEYKGKQELFIEAKPDILKAMLDIAKVQSTGASNRIEGISTSDERLEAIVKEKSEPRNRSESEIAGYREVLLLIHENYEYMNPRVNVILQLHRDLYQYSPSSIGGRFKNSDNSIAETIDGKERVRFQPLAAYETPDDTLAALSLRLYRRKVCQCGNDHREDKDNLL